jgi:DNA (cytosine-5)-methyltransferase 1
MQRERSAISLFTGGGGLDIGLEQAGFRVRVCLDMMQASKLTLALNRPEIPFIDRPIEDVTTSEILDKAGLKRGEASLVHGGPPCQSFSVLGKRGGLDDSRGRLIYEFIRVVDEAQPSAFLLENVNGLTMAHSKNAKEVIREEFEKIGYKTTYKTFNAVNFGVPQFRKRVFFAGSKRGFINLDPRPTNSSNAQVSLAWGELLPAMTVRDAFCRRPMDGLPNHIKREHGSRVRARYLKLKPGKRDKIDHTDRLEWDQPSGTVLVGSSEGGGRPHIHPEEPRVITVREAARLQTFPDDWVFAGTSTAQYRLTGNAVPVSLAKAVGDSLRTELDKLDPVIPEARERARAPSRKLQENQTLRWPSSTR